MIALTLTLLTIAGSAALVTRSWAPRIMCLVYGPSRAELDSLEEILNRPL
jgi:hypothetical protein